MCYFYRSTAVQFVNIKKLVFGLTQQNALGSILCRFKQLRSFGLILTADNAEWALSIHRNVQINIILTGRRDISAHFGKRLFGFNELNA